MEKYFSETLSIIGNALNSVDDKVFEKLVEEHLCDYLVFTSCSCQTECTCCTLQRVDKGNRCFCYVDFTHILCVVILSEIFGCNQSVYILTVLQISLDIHAYQFLAYNGEDVTLEGFLVV